MHSGYTLIDKCSEKKKTNALEGNTFIKQRKQKYRYREKLNLKIQPNIISWE